MAKINLWRVLIGGLVAGLIINAGEIVLNGLILGNQWNALRAAYGLADLTIGQLIAGVIITFTYGIVLIWIYAAIRPCFGPGPRTAVIAGLAFWVIAYVLFLLSMFNGGLVSAEIAITSIVWGVIEAPVAAVAGAWLYQEGEGTFAAA